MSPTADPAALRAARRALGWSLTEAADRIVARAAERGVPVATTRSLRSQLSRWENGHATPEPVYRNLLAELLGHSPIALGIDPTAMSAESSLDRLRAALAEASAVDGHALDLWREQLATAQRLDAELGTDAAASIVVALVDRLDRLLAHTVVRQARTAVAEIVSGAQALAGAHALDHGDHDTAWRHYQRAHAAAGEALSPAASAVATSGLVDVLVDVGALDTALALLAEARAALMTPPGLGHPTAHQLRTDQPVIDQSSALARLAGATALVYAAAGRPGDALAALAEAEAARPPPPPRTRSPSPERGNPTAPLSPVGDHPQARRALPGDPAPGDGRSRQQEDKPAARPVIMDRFHRPDRPVELVDIHTWRGRALVLLRDATAELELRRALAAGPRSIRHRAALLADLATALADRDPAESAEHAREAHSLALRIGAPHITALLARERGARPP